MRSTGRVSPADRLVTLPEGVPKLTLGWEVIHHASKYLRQPNGPNAGQRFKFTDTQVRFILWWYSLDESGKWLFHRAVRRLAKGSGKSPFAALLAIAELCFPVRLKDFDPKVLGGCVGKPVSMPLVQIAATAEAQTENTMRMVRAFARKGSRLQVEYGLDPGKTQILAPNEGKLEVITSSYQSAEGAEVTCVIADELEHWVPGNGGPEFYATLLDNLTKSGSRMIETANAWKPGIGSAAEKSWDAWVIQEEGRSRNKSKILYDARMAPPDARMDDPVSLRKALEHVYGDCWWVLDELDAIMTRIWDGSSSEDDSKRKYFNRPTAAKNAWTTQEKVELLLVDDDSVVEPGEEIVLFFDGSKSRDATALVGCCMSDGHVFVVDAWEPTPKHDGKAADDYSVPVLEVDRAVDRAFETWTVVGFFGDVREFESFVKITWPEKYGDQLLVKAVPAGKDPQPIAWDMRSHTFEFTKAAELTREEINDALFTIDGDPRLIRHLLNTRTAENKYGTSVSKESANSPAKIDLAVCLIGARLVRRQVLASPEWTNRAKERKVVVWR